VRSSCIILVKLSLSTCRLVFPSFLNPNFHPHLDRAFHPDPADKTQSLITFQNWFTSLPGHDYFCEVHEDFIEDDFNLTGQGRSGCLAEAGSPLSSALISPPRPSIDGSLLEGSAGDGPGCRARYASHLSTT